jgi:Pyruvate/2-oxoglutarate dehydrogenase complex, dihydrolipoamide acyltransferase (E2) component, and related enzymes
MPADVIMPALGMAQETGKVLRWLKQEGEAVAKGEPLLEVETDKVTVEIEAPADGTLEQVSAPDGAEVPVGSVIALVVGAGEKFPVEAVSVAPSPAAEPSSSRRRLASPKARRIAQERGVDLQALVGSGPNGAVNAADVESVGSERSGAGDLKVDRIWRLMADRVSHAWQEVPHFSLERHVDATRLESWRAASRRRPGGEATSHTDLLVKLCAEALSRHPRANASWREGAIVPGAGVNVAIAVATDDGLVVPVVHHADTLTLADITKARGALTLAAREGRLRPEDVQGGTFTISNLGMYGVDAFQAIVNAPQAAILAVGRIADRPVALDGEVVVRPMLTLTMSFDHRVIDGSRGAEFLDTIAALVEEPAGLVP